MILSNDRNCLVSKETDGAFVLKYILRDQTSETEENHSRPRPLVKIRTRNIRDVKQMP
jgi:hypothetical protein